MKVNRLVILDQPADNDKDLSTRFKIAMLSGDSKAMKEIKAELKRKELNLSVSSGNSKVGFTASISTLAGETCGKHMKWLDKDTNEPRTCLNDCYALKSQRQYRNTDLAYRRNTRLVRKFSRLFTLQVIDWMKNNRPVQFRWHVAGEIESQGQYDTYSLIATLFPKTQFFLYTKNTDIELDLSVKNFHVFASQWHNRPYTNFSQPVSNAWELGSSDGLEVNEKRMDLNRTVICSSDADAGRTCDNCNFCTNAELTLPNGQKGTRDELGLDVLFYQHKTAKEKKLAEQALGAYAQRLGVELIKAHDISDNYEPLDSLTEWLKEAA